MPTYDYECRDCGHRFELFQSMTAKVKRKCPECGKRTLERLIGPGAGFLFKGDGFYVTDYRSSSYEEGAKSDKPSDTCSPACGTDKAPSGCKAGKKSGK